MTTNRIIQNTPQPRTRQSIASDLLSLGLYRGMNVIVHSSLSSIGWVNGGAVAVVQALLDVITEEGTVVMPTQSTEYSDPVTWSNPAVPPDWWSVIKETMPAYEPEITPSIGMGQIVEVFRTWPGVIRSAHPAVSFAARGKDADKVISNHLIENGLGENSPLARLYELNAQVLLLGVGYDNNTSFHLSEYRAPGAKRVVKGAPVIENEGRVWKVYQDIEYEDELFEEIGKDFEGKFPISVGNVGSAACKLFNQKQAVDFAEKWLVSKRNKVNGGGT